MNMDLMCNEKETLKEHHHSDSRHHSGHMTMHFEPQVNVASADPTFLSERCLENLLKSEETHPTAHFYNLNSEITPKMRRIVAEWMMEVSSLTSNGPAAELSTLFFSLAFLLCSAFLEPIANCRNRNRTHAHQRLASVTSAARSAPIVYICIL